MLNLFDTLIVIICRNMEMERRGRNRSDIRKIHKINMKSGWKKFKMKKKKR